MAKSKRCVACKRPFEPKSKDDELCPPHAEQFEKMYGKKGDEEMNKRGKGKAAAKPEDEDVELFAGVDDDGDEGGEGEGGGDENAAGWSRPITVDDGAIVDGHARVAASGAGVDEVPASAPAKKEPGWTRRPKVAAKRLRLALRFLERFDWARLGADGVQGALAIMANAATKLESRQAAPPRKVEPDATVQVRESARKEYLEDGLFSEAELRDLKVTAVVKKRVRVTTSDGAKLVFPLAHLELAP